MGQLVSIHTNLMTDFDSKLRPDETVQKILISTTSRMVGNYENTDVLITHARPSVYDSSTIFREFETPLSRSGLIIAFETPPVEKRVGVVIPNYTYIGENICAYLSVLFGKRFDCHGLVEANGHYQIPDVTAYSRICNPILPFNSHKPRTRFRIPLEIGQVSLIEKILYPNSGVDMKILQKLVAICKSYMQALQNAEHDPETGYLNLITAGEILSNFFQYSEEEMFDGEILETLNIIRSEIEGGDRRAKIISNRLTSVKRAFVKSLCSLLDDSFYKTSESERNFVHFESENIDKNIGAAYDLRSKYVHTGVSFGGWIDASLNHGDLQMGKPIVNDSEFAKILEKAPNFIGLERLMRYCILKFISSRGLLTDTSK